LTLHAKSIGRNSGHRAVLRPMDFTQRVVDTFPSLGLAFMVKTWVFQEWNWMASWPKSPEKMTG
jgi:hypothetical protein